MTEKTTKIPDCNCGHEFSETSMYHLGDCPRKDLPKQPMCGLPPNAITTAISATARAQLKEQGFTEREADDIEAGLQEMMAGGWRTAKDILEVADQLADKFEATDPDHYHTPIEPIEYIMANGLDFCEGNVIKYITRWQKKGGVEDLKKAKVYIQFLIDKYEEE